MNTEEKGSRLAQPADEEIKLHGDKLGTQVKDAAAKDEKEKDGAAENEAPDSND